MSVTQFDVKSMKIGTYILDKYQLDTNLLSVEYSDLPGNWAPVSTHSPVIVNH